MIDFNPLKKGSQYTQSFQFADPHKDIGSISDATPCVVTLVNHGYSNGDNVTIADNKNGDWHNGGTGRWVVANVTTDTFELQGSKATGYGTLAGGIVAKAWDCSGGTVTFAAVNATLAAGDSLITNTDNGTIVLVQPTFAWGDATVAPTAGQPIGYGTITINANTGFALNSGTYYTRIYYKDSNGVPQEPIEGRIEVKF